MEEQTGLSTKDAQYAICRGTYGGKEWTAQEQRVACERYQDMNSTLSNSGDLGVIAITLIVCIIVAAAPYTLYGRRGSRKRVKSLRKSKM